MPPVTDELGKREKNMTEFEMYRRHLSADQIAKVAKLAEWAELQYESSLGLGGAYNLLVDAEWDMEAARELAEEYDASEQDRFDREMDAICP